LNRFSKDLILKTAEILDVSAGAVVKDSYVAQAIHTITQVKNDDFEVILQGGTSLSKQGIIQRMSEDCDFRIQKTPKAQSLSKSAIKKGLRTFKHEIADALKCNGFTILHSKTHNEGNFTCIEARYQGSENTGYLKPHIKIDLFHKNVLLKPKIIDVTTLVKTIIGEESSDVTFPVKTMAIDETAAEKWVALTRRISNAMQDPKPSDKDLVRHLYDLSQLFKKKLLHGSYKEIIQQKIEEDRRLSKNYGDAYTVSPIETSKNIINAIQNDHKWSSHWDQFLDNMVFAAEKLSFHEACQQLNAMSKIIFEALSVFPA